MKQTDMENFGKVKNFCGTTKANHDYDLCLIFMGSKYKKWQQVGIRYLYAGCMALS